MLFSTHMWKSNLTGTQRNHLILHDSLLCPGMVHISTLAFLNCMNYLLLVCTCVKNNTKRFELKWSPECLIIPVCRWMNFQGDLEDLFSALENSSDGTPSVREAQLPGSSYCSALIKLLPASSDLYTSHVTWTRYFPWM